MCQEKKKEEDLPALKIVWIHQYEDSGTTLKRTKTNYSGQIEQEKFGNKGGMQKDCMDISRDKLAKFLMRRLGNGYKRKTSKEKLGLFK